MTVYKATHTQTPSIQYERIVIQVIASRTATFYCILVECHSIITFNITVTLYEPSAVCQLLGDVILLKQLIYKFMDCVLTSR
jgi:hypothetical protein